MTAFFMSTSKLKKILLFYWLVMPILFGTYLLLLAATQESSVGELLTSIPGLTFSSVISCLSVFQAFSLFILYNECECRQSLVGIFLIFSMVQQVITLNIIGLCLVYLLYRTLPSKRASKKNSGKTKVEIYSLMCFVGFITLIVSVLRLSI